MCCNARTLMNRLCSFAELYINGKYCHRVVIMSIWPKIDIPKNKEFNAKVAEFNKLGSQIHNSSITFWHWSNRLTLKYGPDGKHLTQDAYCCAVRCLATPIFFLKKEMDAANAAKCYVTPPSVVPCVWQPVLPYPSYYTPQCVYQLPFGSIIYH